jgi:hypothetical protein
MADAQLYFAIGIPTSAVLVTLLAGILQFNAILTQITSLESNMNARFNSVDRRFDSLEARFETLIGKLVEIDNRPIG